MTENIVSSSTNTTSAQSSNVGSDIVALSTLPYTGIFLACIYFRFLKIIMNIHKPKESNDNIRFTKLR